jgi:hypothetical protein
VETKTTEQTDKMKNRCFEKCKDEEVGIAIEDHDAMKNKALEK